MVDRRDLLAPVLDGQIEGLPASTTTLSPNSNFYGTIGVPNGQNTGLSRYQELTFGPAERPRTFYEAEQFLSGLDLGTVGRLEQNRPEAGALIVRVGEQTVALGHEAAAKLLVVSAEASG